VFLTQNHSDDDFLPTLRPSLTGRLRCLLSRARHECTALRQVRSVGYDSVTVCPDYAERTVDAEFTRPRLKDAVAEVQGVVDQVLVLSKRYAPGPNDVRVSSISSNKEFEYVRGKEVFTGFNSLQSVTVHINNLSRLSPYLEELLATRISRIKDLSCTAAPTACAAKPTGWPWPMP